MNEAAEGAAEHSLGGAACRTACGAMSLTSLTSPISPTPQLPYARTPRCTCWCTEVVEFIGGVATEQRRDAAPYSDIREHTDGGNPQHAATHGWRDVACRYRSDLGARCGFGRHIAQYD